MTKALLDVLGYIVELYAYVAVATLLMCIPFALVYLLTGGR